ncbi:FliH/SctL family protein [Thalassospira alkalitolerans]|uniref:Uncharacterized protein n=1 Tax=Thalassospira alkalitolerans TaxID=1293890 RepID=A0A1Y2L681_9PROT|nr:FliH/SctL family protein [Thalassospira alkalitolerans]OSQ43745.1 hypothetical protein TALK_20030 [Thalassospira alkalitolerans]
MSPACLSHNPNQRFDMTAIEKFKFSLSFDNEDNVIRSSGDDDEHYSLTKKKKKKEDEAPPPPPPVYTEEQAAQMIAEAEATAREIAQAEGLAQGIEQGRAEILASLEQAMKDATEKLAEKLAEIDEHQKRANARINEDAINVSLGIMRKIAPAWSQQYQLTEIESIVRQCLANLFDVPKVIVKVHPDIETMLSETVEKLAVSRGFSGKVAVISEIDIALGDCHVSWGDGTAVRNTKRVWAEINDIVERALEAHADEHSLPESDMGDPVIQETTHNDLPPAASPAPTMTPAEETPAESPSSPEPLVQEPKIAEQARQSAPSTETVAQDIQPDMATDATKPDAQAGEQNSSPSERPTGPKAESEAISLSPDAETPETASGTPPQTDMNTGIAGDDSDALASESTNTSQPAPEIPPLAKEEGHGTEQVNMQTSPQDDALHSEIGTKGKNDPPQQDGDPRQANQKPDTTDM